MVMNMQTKNTKELEQWIQSAKDEDIDNLIESLNDIRLSDYLEQLLTIKKLPKADVIQASMLPRTYAYQIFQGIKQPSRDKVLQLAFAMKLTIEESDRLLKVAGFSPLYAKKKRDAVLLFAMKQQWNLYHVNEYLNESNLPLLGNYD